VRLDGAAATPARDASGTPLPHQRAADLFPSARLGVRARVSSLLTLKGSAGRFVRFPTLLEQFGDGAFIIGYPPLQPETAWGGDAGLALTVERPRGGIGLEAVFFGRRVSDFIAFVPAANATTVVNIGDTRTLGAEGLFSAHLERWLALTVDYTFLDAVNLTHEPGAYGNQLPGRPAHQLDARLDLRGGPFSVFYDVSYTSQMFRDAQNRNPIPGRALHALGAAFERAPWHFSVEVRNLADLRVIELPLGGGINQGKTTPYPLVDFFDYPLPGRVIYATLALRH
jgi:hypothetical protein